MGTSETAKSSLRNIKKDYRALGTVVSGTVGHREGLVGNMKLKGSLGCSDHEMVEFKVLRVVRRVHRKLVTVGFRRADLGLFRDLFGRVPWDKALEGREAQESWFYYKDISEEFMVIFEVVQCVIVEEKTVITIL
ncbi:hypothetical protein llap_8071 [Limosa lapponica baueri]|uniref:Glycerol kinase n=1 Tax=Limosa lapponica baueri TaxID=1758121 RepID=A0A2I0U6G7_LIMLA|nr:hypothetical protein llap_8071 [Limosa lapponica baueri]